MNARNRSVVETPPDGVDQPPLAGFVNPHPLGRGGSFGASLENSEMSIPAVPPGRQDARMVPALEEYMEALREGRPCSRDEFLAQYADIAEELGECLSGLEFIQHAVDQLEASRGMAATSLAEPMTRAQLGDYRILREVGRGGMGVVYEAHQVSLGRRVALKVLPFAAAIDPKQRQRFQIEAQAAAQLHHPHIVPIFGVGCDHGVHYYAMQFVEGRSLAAIIHELRGDHGAPAGAGGLSAPVSTEEASGSRTIPPAAGSTLEVSDAPATIDQGGDDGSRDAGASGPGSPADDPALAPTAVGPVHQDREFCRNVARLGAEAADALDHAHGLGILHRDIKPGNLLIGPHGALWITDFGLARFPSDLSLTGTGDVVGTVRYMSPEQAQARRGVVDQRTDIYSLGVTLYELLTLRPAFNGRDHQELLRQIATDEPVPPRRLNPAIPRDLETIVLKAMAKDPAHRYATAQELAADLGRFLADEPILARRPGAVERAVRWARRHWEIVATAAAVLVISLAISTTLILAKARETKAAAERAVSTRNEYYTYMVESYPLIDNFAKEVLDQAKDLAMGRAGPAHRQEAIQTFEQWLKILEQLSNLPRTDRESRIVIGRACTRLGYARAWLSLAKGTPDRLFEPVLLAQATEDFRRSIAVLDELLAATPGDATIRRFLADALGVFGQGCCCRFASRDQEAERCYRRAIQLRRELIRGSGSDGVPIQGHLDIAGESSNFSLLLGTVQVLAGMLEMAHRQSEAEELQRQLKDDVVALAARFPGADFEDVRRKLAEPLVRIPPANTPEGRSIAVQNCPLAMILDPKNPWTVNNLAWALVSAPDDPWFDSKRAEVLAREAVDMDPTNWAYWDTLGVAAFRNRDWDTAADSLLKSIHINGGEGIDYLFLAMTRWHQGQGPEARQRFDQAMAWIAKTKSADPELRRFHTEAATLMSLPGPDPQPAQRGEPKAQAGAMKG
jgi:eukaryotic-like serine/threonine-protein kinase